MIEKRIRLTGGHGYSDTERRSRLYHCWWLKQQLDAAHWEHLRRCTILPVSHLGLVNHAQQETSR